MRLSDSLDQDALVWLAGHDYRPVIATFEKMVPRVQLQATHSGIRVAGKTVLCQHGPDMRLEKLACLFRAVSCLSCGERDRYHSHQR